jgi:hypothetical protein
MTSGYANGVISFLGAGICPLRFRPRLLALRSREVAPARAAGGTLAVVEERTAARTYTLLIPAPWRRPLAAARSFQDGRLGRSIDFAG